MGRLALDDLCAGISNPEMNTTIPPDAPDAKHDEKPVEDSPYRQADENRNEDVHESNRLIAEPLQEIVLERGGNRSEEQKVEDEGAHQSPPARPQRAAQVGMGEDAAELDARPVIGPIFPITNDEYRVIHSNSR
ncbi:hypothetical protein ACFC1B_10245 [Streptomyces xiamenensis]|uniref:hypothetical protein n=1 Tax=Streptomyces TaxID=1883 RepID=UPI001F277E3B|nr:hypothetical protein [Streptomyces sp. NRRL F-2890]